MFIGQVAQVREEVIEYQGTKDASIRWLITDKQGAKNFAMRLVTVQADGLIPLHTHSFEHEIFVLRGHGELLRDAGSTPVGPDSFVFVAGGESHGFRTIGSEPLEMICCINMESSPD